MTETPYDSREFEARVHEYGGRVDFVFGAAEASGFKECHASTVVGLAKGDLLCAWFGGTHEKHPDVAIWLSRFARNAWSAPKRVAKVNDTAHWNPVLFRDPARGIFLFFKVGPEIAEWQTYWMRSTDGASWAEPVELIPGDRGGRGPVKNKPIILSSGAWLAPASSELAGWAPFADRSEDGGASWRRTEYFPIDRAVVSGQGAIQPTFWESEPGRVHALMRSGCGRILRSDSQNDGKTWSSVYLTGLPNNNSGIDALRLADGRVLLVYNPVAENWGPRTPLHLAVSVDNGKVWRDLACLESGEGEFSYPAIVPTRDGVALSYTWKRQRIRVWQIPLRALA